MPHFMPENSEKPPASKPQSVPAGSKPRRRWARRIFRTGLVVFGLLALFHRPLLEAGMRLALIKIAAKHYVTLDVHFSGSFFTNLTIRDVKAVPNGKGVTPIERISIQAVRLDYSIPHLIQHGVGEFLTSYEISNADLAFLTPPSKTQEEHEQKKSVAQDLNNLLGQPALYADRVKIENFNLSVRSDTDLTEVKNVNLLFHPWEPGYLKIGRIKAPGLPAWENLSAETSYASRNLFVKGLALDPELVIDELNFDSSQRAQNKGSFYLKGRFFGGTAELSIRGSKLPKKGENLESSYDTGLKLDAAGIDIQAAGAYFNAKNLPAVRLAWLTTTFTGEPEKPRTWKGGLAARTEASTFGKITTDAIEAEVTFGDGTAQITSANVAMGRNFVQLEGSAQLPDLINDFSKTDGSAKFTLQAPDLPRITGTFLPNVATSGSVLGEGKVTLHERSVSADVKANASQINYAAFGLSSATLSVHARKPLDPPDQRPLENLEGQVAFSASGLRADTVNFDSAAVDGELKNGLVSLRKVEFSRGESSVALEGTYRLPSDGGDYLHTPIDGHFTISAPKLETFGLGVKGTVLTGHLDGSGSIRTVNNIPEGTLELKGGDFTFGKFKAQRLAAKIDVANNEASISQFELQVDGNNQFSLAGKAGLEKPMKYEGAGLVLFKNLGVLNPLLETFGIHDDLAGSVDFTLDGQGNLQPQAHSGKAQLSIKQARYGKIDLREAKIDAIYGPSFAETSQLHAVSGATSFDGVMEWRDQRLKLRDINLRQGNLQVLSGYLSVPFEPQNQQLVPFDKRIAANINATQLDIEKLLGAFGQAAPASGNVTANLIAGGTIFEPSAHLKITAKGLKAKATPQLDPAEVDFSAHYAEKDLTVDGSARQKDIQPLTIKGHVPLDLQAALERKALDPSLPLDLTVKLPPTSLALLPKVVPAIRSAAGTVALDARVAGSVGKPQLSGASTIKIDYARMKSEGVPAIGTLQANLAFTQDSIAIQKFHGEVGGGGFDLAGKVQFPKITEPVFDLKLKSNSVLREAR